MIKIFNNNESSMLHDFLKKLNKENIKFNNNHRVYISVISNKITSAIIVNIIDNRYTIEDILYLKYDHDELETLLNYVIENLKEEKYYKFISYDNNPYKANLNDMLISSGFNYNYFVLEDDLESDRISLMKPYINVNDRTDDIKEYIIKKSNNKLVNIQNTNTLSLRNKNNDVIGVLRFLLSNDVIYVDNLYAEDDSIYIDLIEYLKNITTRKIEIGLLPLRYDLIEILIRNNFTLASSQYIYSL